MWIKEEFESLKDQHPIYQTPYWTIYYPNQNIETLRRYVTMYNTIDKTQHTTTYARFILECKLNRSLTNNEEAHHKNNFEFDDRLENLEIVNKFKHRRDNHRKPPQVFTCPTCNTVFILVGRKLTQMKADSKKILNYTGPYCNKSCSDLGQNRKNQFTK